MSLNLVKTENETYEEFMNRARPKIKLHYANLEKKTFSRKKKQGYKFWCFFSKGHFNDYKIYFKSYKSAEAWLLKTKRNEKIQEI